MVLFTLKSKFKWGMTAPKICICFYWKTPHTAQWNIKVNEETNTDINNIIVKLKEGRMAKQHALTKWSDSKKTARSHNDTLWNLKTKQNKNVNLFFVIVHAFIKTFTISSLWDLSFWTSPPSLNEKSLLSSFIWPDSLHLSCHPATTVVNLWSSWMPLMWGRCPLPTLCSGPSPIFRWVTVQHWELGSQQPSTATPER